jgi:hypothetical protein
MLDNNVPGVPVVNASGYLVGFVDGGHLLASREFRWVDIEQSEVARCMDQPATVRITTPIISIVISSGVCKSPRLTIKVVAPVGGCEKRPPSKPARAPQLPPVRASQPPRGLAHVWRRSWNVGLFERWRALMRLKERLRRLEGLRGDRSRRNPARVRPVASALRADDCGDP